MMCISNARALRRSAYRCILCKDTGWTEGLRVWLTDGTVMVKDRPCARCNPEGRTTSAKKDEPDE